ncbi:MAG: hypothetical protein AAFQ23_09305 [Cyanobacteria bacterium J06623_1]
MTKLDKINFQPWQVGDYELVAIICDRTSKFLGQNTFEIDVTIPN